MSERYGPDGAESERPQLEGVTLSALSTLLQGSGRARSVWHSLRTGRDPFDDEEISAPTRRILAERTRATALSVERFDRAPCGTRKLGISLGDGRRIETVLIPGERRTTVCISSQSGCGRGCIFCVTATMGLERGLTVGEIVGQVLLARAEVRGASLPPLRNVVFMGMGEPLDNLEAVRDAIAILCDARALAVAPRHVTLSTVGTTPDAIRATRGLPVKLAWSVHAVDDALRVKLVPTMRHSMLELREAFLERSADPGATLFVEMTLIAGLNDAPEQAAALADFLAPFPPGVRVNLIPMNPGRSGLTPSSDARTIAFRQVLREREIFCAIRRPRGLETSAACGQLVAG